MVVWANCAVTVVASVVELVAVGAEAMVASCDATLVDDTVDMQLSIQQ